MKNKTDVLTKEFEGTGVEIIIKNNEPLFELYSTGAALGYIKKNSIGKIYPQKDRIDKVIENAEISMCVHGVHNYLTEDALYDFMLESRTDKCKKFRKWVTTEVLPSIRKHGAYISDGEIDLTYINNKMRFSEKQTINTFALTAIDDIKQLVEDFTVYADTLDTKTRVVRCNSAVKGLKKLHDKLAKESVTNIGDCYNLLRLQDNIKTIAHIAENRHRGQKIAYRNRKIKELENKAV